MVIKLVTFRSQHLPRQLVGVEEEEVAGHLAHEGRLQAPEHSRNPLVLEDLLSQPERPDLRGFESLLKVGFSQSLR